MRDEVVLALDLLVQQRVGVGAGHLEAARGAAGGGLHEQLDHVDLRAFDERVAHDHGRRRGDRAEDAVLGIDGQLDAQESVPVEETLLSKMPSFS